MPVFRLGDSHDFPPAHLAAADGLLAIGGDLHPDRLLNAYRNGIFPWYNESEPILWHAPDPRFVLFPDKLKVSKSMQQVLRSGRFRISYNLAFEGVMEACRKVPREGQAGTWIQPEMIESYTELHKRGFAHSVECWEERELVGGLYGICLGSCFMGESMFALRSNASKAAFITLLNEHAFKLIDCQVHTDHLASLGAELIPMQQFDQNLRSALLDASPMAVHNRNGEHSTKAS